MPSSTLRLGTVLLLAALPAQAQFTQFAATDDGSRLFFTSQLLLKGESPTAPWPEFRLYQFGPDGTKLFAERGVLAPTGGFSSADGTLTPSVSGDGTLVSFTYSDVCLTDPDCSSPVVNAVVRGRKNLDLGAGTVQLSRNGRWALVTRVIFDGGTNSVSVLVDLTTGQSTPVPDLPFNLLFGAPWQTIASDGTVLVEKAVSSASRQGGLWKQGAFTPIQLPDGTAFEPLALSDDATTVIAWTTRGIVALNLASSRTALVAPFTTSLEAPLFMAVSNNGRRVLYRIPEKHSLGGPAYVWDGAIGATLQVPLADGELASDGTLSGFGEFAFVATTRGRILRFATRPGGEIGSLFPAVPNCDDPGAVAFGSLAHLKCPFTGSIAELQGHLTFQGQPTPILYSRPDEIAVQIPWKGGGGNFVPTILSIEFPTPSPFQAAQELRVYDGAPAILPAEPGHSSLFGIKIVKGDFSGYVTRQPLPGDIIHIYMAGLGPVAGDVETGVPASLTKLNPIQWKLSCRFQPGGQAVEPLFAGLAPGMIGVYQVTFGVLPGSGPVPMSDLSCDLTAPNNLTGRFGPGTIAQGMCSGCGFFTVIP